MHSSLPSVATEGRRAHLTPNDPADAVLVSALVSGISYTRAGELAGVSKAAVKRRMATPEFTRTPFRPTRGRG